MMKQTGQESEALRGLLQTLLSTLAFPLPSLPISSTTSSSSLKSILHCHSPSLSTTKFLHLFLFTFNSLLLYTSSKWPATVFTSSTDSGNRTATSANNYCDNFSSTLLTPLTLTLDNASSLKISNSHDDIIQSSGTLTVVSNHTIIPTITYKCPNSIIKALNSIQGLATLVCSTKTYQRALSCLLHP